MCLTEGFTCHITSCFIFMESTQCTYCLNFQHTLCFLASGRLLGDCPSCWICLKSALLSSIDVCAAWCCTLRAIREVGSCECAHISWLLQQHCAQKVIHQRCDLRVLLQVGCVIVAPAITQRVQPLHVFGNHCCCFWHCCCVDGINGMREELIKMVQPAAAAKAKSKDRYINR
jgi:hypothetical protein